MTIKIIKEAVSRQDLAEMAKGQFGDFVKAMVDIQNNIMAVGADLHADEEALLLEQGSRQELLWGINIYPDQHDESWIEFDSMINLRPSQGNRSRGVDKPEIRDNIRKVVERLVVT
ncbi:MAG: hypothetical protein HY747_06865 [Elusimicrobia bacterium]|nr:hypothetical protein [Elusimicrobiota bacterium]